MKKKVQNIKQERPVENIQRAWKVDMANMILVSQLLQQNPEVWAKCLSLSPFQGTMESSFLGLILCGMAEGAGRAGTFSFTLFSLQMCFD